MGLSRACEKTGLETSQLEQMVEDLELQLQQRNGKDIQSSEIGELVLEKLRSLSEVAYVRFASVYRQFRGINDFISALEGIHADKGRLAAVR